MTKLEHPPSEAGVDRPASTGQVILEYARTIIVVVLIVTVVRTFLFESFVIPSGSMIPTLQVGDYIWVSKYSYGYSKYSLPFSLICLRAVSGPAPRIGAMSLCSVSPKIHRLITLNGLLVCRVIIFG